MQTAVESKTPSLLRIPEAARELAVSVRTCWRLASTGKLETVRIGRAVRITRESVASLIAKGGI